MTYIICIAGGLLYGACLLFCYRMGLRDGQREEPPQKPNLPPKKKAKPMSDEEKAALDKQRRIEEYKG
jgi:hypothetical protein